MRVIGLILLVTWCTWLKAQVPISNLWLSTITEQRAQTQNELLIDAQWTQLTFSDGYSNQPYFVDPTSVLFTEMHTKEGQSQTDIWRLNIANKQQTRISNSLHSEYSPTPLLIGDNISVIKVNELGKQELWELSQGKPIKHWFSEIEPVGYHVWINPESALLFVLGEPHRLELAYEGRESIVIDTNIGASLWRIPGSYEFSYSKVIAPGKSELRSFSPLSQETKKLADLPEGADYYTWTPSGVLLTATSSAIHSWDKSSKTWKQILQTSKLCPGGITRMAVGPKSPEASYAESKYSLVLVCQSVK